MPTSGKKKNSKRRRKKTTGSLLAPESMGGIIGGDGFDFQSRYAACHVPLWLQNALHQILIEGSGDIDLRFVENGRSFRDHIQTKDHDVTPAEFKAVVQQFAATEKGMPGVYRQFILACPSLASGLRPVERGLNRYRGAKPYYEDATDGITPTKADLLERIRKADLEDCADFIIDKVFIEIGHGDLRHDDRATELFVARMLKHPSYADRLHAMVQPAYAELLRQISAHKGKTLDRTRIEEILNAVIGKGGAAEPGITLWVQNWTKETFDLPADYVLDWSDRFDRSTREVPSESAWNTELIPALRSLQKEIAAKRVERLIRFRGKCALSTGIAVGAIFPAVGGWTFELPQPPASGQWRSDAQPTSPYSLQTKIVAGDSGGSDLVVGLNIKGDGRKDILEYVQSTGESPRLFSFMATPSQGIQGLAGPEDAVAFAKAVRDQLGQLLKTHGLRRTRLFFFGPLALALFLGQHLTSVGEIQLFEYQDPGYVPSCLLKT